MDSPEYGSLAPLVTTVGWLMSAVVAIGASWKGRTNWEPVEEDLKGGPRKVAGVITAVGIAIPWTQLSSQQHVPLLVRMAIWSSLVTLLALLIYGFLTSVYTATEVYSTGETQTKSRKIVAGFRLTPRARKIKNEQSATVQDIFKGMAYNCDAVWVPGWRGITKMTFNLFYIILTVFGSLAVSFAAMLLLLSQAKS